MDYGTSSSYSVLMDGPYSASGASALKMVSISAPVADWKGATSPYSQVVAVDGISINSKIDIQLSVEQMEKFHDMDIAFSTENDGGIVTLYAFGDKPTEDCILQATVSEVLIVGTDSSVILGNAVSTNMPRSDYEQTDPTKADYIKNKPDNDISKAQDTADSAQEAAEKAQESADAAQETADEAKTAAENALTDAKTYTDSKHFKKTATISTTWTGNAAPYTQEVAVEGVLATDYPHVWPVYSDTLATALLEQEAWLMIGKGVPGEGKITFTCLEEKPAVAIPIQIEVNR